MGDLIVDTNRCLFLLFFSECEEGRFGLDCAARCNCYDAKEVCHVVTGECHQSGCAVGYTATNCLSCT